MKIIKLIENLNKKLNYKNFTYESNRNYNRILQICRMGLMASVFSVLAGLESFQSENE